MLFCDVKRGRLTDKLMPRRWVITNALSNCNKIAVNKVNKLERPAAKTSNRYFMEISRNCIFHRKSSLFCTQKIYTFASGWVWEGECQHGWGRGDGRLTLSERGKTSVVKWKVRVRASTTKKDIFDPLSPMTFPLSRSIIERVKETRTCVKATDEHYVSDVTTSFVLMMICVRRTCKFCLHRIKSSEREKQKMFVMGKKNVSIIYAADDVRRAKYNEMS